MTVKRRTVRKDTGVLAKFRRLPGARLAVAAFVVTVAVGLGGPPAYAWWSQKGDAQITVTAGTAKPLAAPVDLKCVRDPKQQGNNGSRDTTVFWAPGSAPNGSSYIVDVTALESNGKASTGVRSYALPPSSTSVKLADLPGLDDWFETLGKNNDKFNLTVRNVWITSPVQSAQLLEQSEATKYPYTAARTLDQLQYKENKNGYHC